MTDPISTPPDGRDEHAQQDEQERSAAHGLLGPPVEAFTRLVATIRAALRRLFARLSGFWYFLFLGARNEPGGDTAPPTPTAPLLASVVVALTLYSWPTPDILPAWIFVPVVVIVWWFSLRSIQYLSLRGSGSRWESELRESGRRAGLVAWERAGLVLGLAGTVGAVILRPTAIPLTLAVSIGFLVLLGQPPDERQLRTVRIVPPLPAPLPDAPPGEDGDGAPPEGYVAREYHWRVEHALGTDDLHLRLFLHEATYVSMKATNPGEKYDGETPQFADYIVNGTTPDIERAASDLLDLSREHHYSTYEEISSALAMAQSIEYSLDEESTGQAEYWRYPIETLYDETGDCEDTTLLAGAILRRLGHTVATILMPTHVALAVALPGDMPGDFITFHGHRMYYCETTGTGWKVGELPPSVDRSKMSLHAVPPL